MGQEVAMEDANDPDRDNLEDKNKKDDGTTRDKEPKRTKNGSTSSVSGETPVHMEIHEAHLRFGTVDSGSTVSTPKKTWAQLVEDEERNLSAPASVVPKLDSSKGSGHLLGQQLGAADVSVPAASVTQQGSSSQGHGRKSPASDRLVEVAGQRGSSVHGAQCVAAAGATRASTSPRSVGSGVASPTRETDLSRRICQDVTIPNAGRCPVVPNTDGGMLQSPGHKFAGRSSERLRTQPNADATQLERAMMIAQRRNDLISQGYSLGGPLDTTMGVSPTGGATGIYGFWLQTSPDGRSGILQPGWLAAY